MITIRRVGLLIFGIYLGVTVALTGTAMYLGPHPHKPMPINHRIRAQKRIAHAHDPMPGLKLYPLRVVATSYCPSPGLGLTATATHPRRGVAAVDPRVIPLGSVILWNHRVYLAEDTGGDIVGNRVDLWNDDCGDSVNWGRQPITILVGRA